MSTFLPLEPMDVTLFGKTVLADIIKLGILSKDHPGLSKWALHLMTSVLTRDTQRRDTSREEGQVKTELGMELCRYKPRIPGAPQKLPLAHTSKMVVRLCHKGQSRRPGQDSNNREVCGLGVGMPCWPRTHPSPAIPPPRLDPLLSLSFQVPIHSVQCPALLLLAPLSISDQSSLYKIRP